MKDCKKGPYTYDHDKTLVLGDYFAATDDSIETGLQANPFKWSGEPQGITLSGHIGQAGFSLHNGSRGCTPYVLEVEPSKTYRLRLIGSTVLSLVEIGIEGHGRLGVIEADGANVEKAHVDHMQIAPGQRYSFLLKTKSLVELLKTENSQFWIQYESRDRPQVVKGYALLKYRLPGGISAPPLPDTLPATAPLSLTNKTYDYLEHMLQPLTSSEKSQFPRLEQVTRTVTIQVNQIVTNGEYVNGTANGTVSWA